MPKLTIAILALSVALVLASAQANQVAASPSSSSYSTTSYPTSYWHHQYWSWGYWGWPYNYYYYYYPYYYPYYYSSGYCPTNSYSYGNPYYYGYYSYYYSGYYSCSPSSYTLTVSTDPSNLGTVNGGGSYSSGSSASFSVTQPTVQVSPSARYVFDHWSGDYSGSGTSGTVTMNNARSITAVYQLQYYLSLTAQPQNAPAPQGSGWYSAGETANAQNGGQTIGDSESRLVFQGWSIDGQQPQPGSTLSLVMNSAHNVSAVYGQQYYLNVQTDQGVTTGSGWYDAGSTAQIYVSTPVSTQYGVSIIFNGWQGDIQSNSQSTTVLMDGPKNVVATWRTDSTVLYLTIAAIIIAAVLIVVGIIAFATRGRAGTQAPPPQASPPARGSQVSQNTVQQNSNTETTRGTEDNTRKESTETQPEEQPTPQANKQTEERTTTT